MTLCLHCGAGTFLHPASYTVVYHTGLGTEQEELWTKIQPAW